MSVFISMYFIDITPGQTKLCVFFSKRVHYQILFKLDRSADIRLFAYVNQNRNYAKVNLIVGGLKIGFHLIRFHG